MKVTELKELIADLSGHNHQPSRDRFRRPEGQDRLASWGANGFTIWPNSYAGSFYQTGQGDKPLVSEGDAVTDGQVICVIDGGGQVNEIESEVAGQVATIHVKPGEPVEAGQALFGIQAIARSLEGNTHRSKGIDSEGLRLKQQGAF